MKIVSIESSHIIMKKINYQTNALMKEIIKQGFFLTCPASTECNKASIYSGTTARLLVFCPVLLETAQKQ